MMKRTGRTVFILVIAVISLGLATAVDAGESSRGGTFILPGWDARGAALGGAATILIRDERSAYWNPANLTFLESPRASVGTMKPVPGLDDRFSMLCVGTGLFEKRGGPIGMPAPDSTSASDSTLSPDSTFLRESTPTWRRAAIALAASHLGLDLAQGSQWNESTFGLSIAYAVAEYNRLGITVRMMKSWTDLENADAWGVSFDAGLTERITDHVWLAATGKNILGRVFYPEKTDSLDSTWSLALAYEGLLERVSVECDAVVKYGVLNRIQTGVEIIVVRDILALLAGADLRMTEGERLIPSVGFATTYRFAEIALASSFDPEDSFGRQTRVSMSFVF